MYVDCLNGTQSVCTHPHCKEYTPKCNEPHPEHPWRTCVSYENHKGKHYVPPASFNYEYWE